MDFNSHFGLPAPHASFGASKYHWIRYDDEKFKRVFQNMQMAKEGTELHELAARLIKHGIQLPEDPYTTYAAYVNDSIGYKMKPEQTLYFSDDFYGTADAISFMRSKLRVHDLKTGLIPGSFDQLCVYAAWFCLEYACSPTKIKIELRIYQEPEVLVLEPEPAFIQQIMDKTRHFNKMIPTLR